MRIAPLCLAAVCACGARAPRDGGVLVAAIGADPGHLNPAITTNGNVHTAASLLFDGLVQLDDDLVVHPALATSWSIRDGGRTYQFALRRTRWHDGQAFTAHDVKFTFDSLLLRFHARTRASLAPALLGIDAPDDTTVVFHLRRPYAPLLKQLDAVEAPILPRHVYAVGDPLRNPANIRPVGTGPFRFGSYLADREIRLEANPSYFGGAPSLREVVLRVIPDAAVQVLALENGEVDWLFAVPGIERRRLARDPDVAIGQTALGLGGTNCMTTFGFNLDRPTFRDVRVRRAIAHAIDRAQFLERVAFGEGRVPDAPISSRISFAHASGLALPAYDTAEASRLLDAAGWRRGGDANGVRRASGVAGVRDGTPFVIQWKGLTGQKAYGDLLQAQLRAVGIDVRVEALEQALFANAVFTARDFDMAIASYCNGADPEIGVRRQYVSSSIAPVPFSNMAGYRNAVMDGLFDGASAELNLERRRALYRRIQEIAVRDQPYVWLLESVGTFAYRRRCRGFSTIVHFAATATCAQ